MCVSLWVCLREFVYVCIFVCVVVCVWSCACVCVYGHVGSHGILCCTGEKHTHTHTHIHTHTHTHRSTSMLPEPKSSTTGLSGYFRLRLSFKWRRRGNADTEWLQVIRKTNMLPKLHYHSCMINASYLFPMKQYNPVTTCYFCLENE